MRKAIRLPAMAGIAFIRLYQLTFARMLTPRCRFEPTCSQYAIDSIRARGLIRGGIAAAWRIVRCGPWSAGGLDPAPARGANHG